MKKRIVAVLLCASMAMSMTAGCGNTAKTTDTKAKTETSSDTSTDADAEKEKAEQNAASAKAKTEADVETATEEEVQEFMNDTDEKTVLVDSRAQESYAGWALEGAKNGGHLKNAVLFSERWLDCEYTGSAPRTAYLERAMEAQHITKDSDIIVYDYDGEHAKDVASYFVEQGIKDVSIYQANDMIDDGTDLESYTNYDRFLPSETVKSISDVKTGKESELSEDAKAVVGDNLDKVVLVDVGWGNAKQSSYFSAGHVPGAVHINTDSYERPRVYVPEKRSDYAKEWRLISLEEFRDSVCPQYGITKDSIVILTGTGTAPQGRLAFMLRSLGVKVYAMSGTLVAWNYNGYDLDTDTSTLVIPESVDSFGSNTIENPDEILWMDDIKAILSGEKEGQVADNRGEEEWNGEYSGYSYHDLSGHLDGAVWCLQGDEENGTYFYNVDNTPRTQTELKNYMESNGVDTSKTVAFYCGDSWGAAMIAYWCQSVDLNNIKEWGNGWIPWSNEGNEFIDHNEGNEFIDHNGNKVHYDKYRDAVLDENGNDVSDGTNILADEKKE